MGSTAENPLLLCCVQLHVEVQNGLNPLDVLPLNSIVNKCHNSECCGTECCGNNMHKIVVNMMSPQYLQLKLDLL